MEEHLISITLTVDQWNRVLEGLQELPAKIANPINNLIVEQANTQLLPKETVELPDQC